MEMERNEIEQAEPGANNGVDRKIAFYLFLGALAVHLLFLMQYANSPFFWVPRLDALYHDMMAQQILKNALPAEPFFRAPAYGYFLAGIYALFGVENYIAVRAIHALLGSVSVVFLYLIGCRLFSTRVGILAAVSMALYGPLIFHLSDLHTPVLEVFCLLLFCLLYLQLREIICPTIPARAQGEKDLQKGLILALVAGLIVGVWAIARPNALLAIPVALIALVGRRPTKNALIACVAFLVGTALFPLLVTLRNATVGKDTVFIAWFGGINLYLANQPNSNGMYSGSPKRYHFKGDYEEVVALYAKDEAEKALGRPLKYSEVDRYWRQRAGDFWRETPGDALKLAGKKLVLIFTRREIRNIVGYDYIRTEWTSALNFAFFGFWYAGPFGLLGIVLAWRTHPDSRPLGALTLLYLLSFVAFIAADRYRVSLIPLLLLFAAYAVFYLFDAIHARNWKNLTVPLTVLAALLIFVNIEWYQTVTPADFAKDTWSAGNRYNAMGKYPEAEQEMQKALKLDPGNAEVWSGLGEAFYYQSKFEEAAAIFAEAAKRADDPSEMLYNLALCYKEMGKTAEARAILTELVRRDPNYKAAQELLQELSSPAITRP